MRRTFFIFNINSIFLYGAIFYYIKRKQIRFLLVSRIHPVNFSARKKDQFQFTRPLDENRITRYWEHFTFTYLFFLLVVCGGSPKDNRLIVSITKWNKSDCVGPPSAPSFPERYFRSDQLVNFW